MPKSLNYYVQKFVKLRVDRARGIAPHKPILLLSVIDLVKQGALRQNRIFLSPELIATFLKFWSHLGSDSHCSDIAQPFFYTRSEGFWHLKANLGYEATTISQQARFKTLKALREAVQYERSRL